MVAIANTTGRSGLSPLRIRVIGWLVACIAVAIVAATGITVVPDAQVARTDLAGNPLFDARQFVDSLWASRVLPLFHDHATDIGIVLDAWARDQDAAGQRYGHRSAASDAPWTFVVRGDGQTRSADTRSRHATLTIDAGGHEVVLQIGPVIFGSALRDGLPFVSFAQVQNQIQFAQISRELNDRASKLARSGADISRLVPGAHVSFTGAMAAGEPPQVTAVTLQATP